MAQNAYTVTAVFKIHPDAAEKMKQLIADVTVPSLDEDGCIFYHWSQGTDDPSCFSLYMNWRDRESFDAHVKSPHVKKAEVLLNEGLLTEPSEELHWYRL